ncbi:MAG TPA: type II secretion system F family protein [Chloroflexota bacterium]
MSIFLACVAASAVGLIILGFYLPQTEKDPVRSRLAQFADRPKSLEEIELEQPFTDRVLRPMIASVSKVIRRFMPKSKTEKPQDAGPTGLQKRLVLAGNPNNLPVNDFIGIVGVSMVGFGALAFVLMGLSGADFLTNALVSVVGLGLGYLMPTFWLSMRVTGRQKEITLAMPDALDLLVIAVEAGLGFDAAVQRYTEKATNALAKEFRRVISELRLGRARREALKEMVNRTEVPDLSTFISAIIQADQLGVSISRVLSVQADQMRLLRRQRAEEQAAKAPLKMLFPMIFLIFPSMFVVILGPSIPSLLGGAGPL